MHNAKSIAKGIWKSVKRTFARGTSKKKVAPIFPEPRRIFVKPYVPQPGSKPVSLVAKRAPPASKEATQRPQDDLEMSAPASPEPEDTSFLEETESDILWTKEYLHCLCQRFFSLDPEKQEETADAVALEHFDLFVEHVFESTESACEEFMCYVVSSPHCNVREAMKFLVPKAYGSEEESKEELIGVLKATRQIGAIIRYGSDLEELSKWVRPIYMVFTKRLLKAPERPPGELTREDYRTYMNQGEAMNTIQAFMKRLHLVEDMKFRLAGPSDLDKYMEFQSPPGSSPTPSSSLESTGVNSGPPCPES